uniref:Mitochondrial proton/calcium exchanger protein n=1 Tax=Chenopodium quinoa TaxID=63459 RepID=A0A803M5M1_CHEQI
MAARILVRRKKCLLDYLNVQLRYIQIYQSASPDQSSQYFNFRSFSSTANSVSSKTNHVDEGNAFSSFNPKSQVTDFSAQEVYRSTHYVVRSPAYQYDRQKNGMPTSIALRLQSIRHASTATAGQPEYDDDENEEVAAKKRKDASPEECDQAVVGLSSAKAKVRSKLQDSQKSAKSVLHRVWATLLGIGPAMKAIASMSREDWAKKMVHWNEVVKSTARHYWLGCKLLWADVRISSRLLLKLAGGKSLSRRERQQLTRTTADIFRLVPLAVFVIVPFMEFLLPVFLKFFPNMLPSTFQDKMREQDALKRRLTARIEYAKFLQDTVKQMSKEVQNSHSGEMKKTAEDLDEFLNKVRKGDSVSNEEILGFAKLFNDELTLDNISRPRLVNMCKYMGISPFGTDAYLRYNLRDKLKRIKADDRLIQAEGIESLSEAELREECRERGMLGIVSVEEMRQLLRDWLDLSLNHSVPSSLLILSRAFMVSGKLKPEEVVQATLSSLPDEVVDTIGVTSLPSEDSVSERRRKLEYLEMQEELIKDEEERNEEDAETKGSAKDDIDSVSGEREEFLRLVNKEIDLYNTMVEKEGTDGEADALKAYKAAREESDHAAEVAVRDKASSALIEQVDEMLQKLEKEIDDVDAKIGDRWQLLDRDFDGKVTPEEVAAAAMYLKHRFGKEGVEELISNLAKDRDGKILVEDIVRLGHRAEDDNTTEPERRD